MLKVTTSWDDGDILDKRLSDLLSQYGIKGTFYISKNYRPERLSEEDMREISKAHEIGAHTLTHPDLRALSNENKKEEIVGSKKWLEEILQKQVVMFCYPKGFFDDSCVEIVKNAGFLGARTTKMGILSSPSNPYFMDTTLQVYPFPFRKLNAKKYYWGKILEPYTQRAPALKELGVSFQSMQSWLTVSKATFDIALKKGGVFHLWGHSWEIEKYGMWEDLEKFFQHMANKKDCEHVTNGELLF